MRIAVMVLGLALVGCTDGSGSDPEAGPTRTTVIEVPSVTGDRGQDAPPPSDVDPCSLLDDEELSAAFADLFEPPAGVRTSPGGVTDLCSWQDAGAGAVLRVELDTAGRIPVPPADPLCSETDCPDPGLGIESRADLRDTIRYVVARLDDVTVRVQEIGLNLTGPELIALAAAAAARVDPT